MVSRPTAERRFTPVRPRITSAPRRNSLAMVSATNTERERHTSEKKSRKPSRNATAPASSPSSKDPPKLRFTLSKEVLRQASSGPTPVRKSRKSPMGILTLLKKGGPTLILLPETASESTGKSVPESTATHATNRIRLLKRKLDSRDTRASSWLSLLR